MQSAKDDRITDNQRRGPRVPIEFFRTEALGQIDLPENLPLETHRGEVTALELRINRLAIGHRRRIATRSQRSVTRISEGANRGLPQFASLQIEGQKGVLPGQG